MTADQFDKIMGAMQDLYNQGQAMRADVAEALDGLAALSGGVESMRGVCLDLKAHILAVDARFDEV